MHHVNLESQNTPARVKNSYFNLLGVNIKEARAELGISQVVLAKISGIDRSYISQLERGLVNPTFSLLLSLANALQVPLLTLIDIE
ncbi:MAG: helix-turn-helix transcriptional regulator [Betaproteobacteria bacterium]